MEHPQHKLASALSWLILALGLGTVGFTAFLVVISYTPAPYLDHWAFLHLFAQHKGSISLSVLWAQHNEHRMVFPKLLYFADLYFGAGQNILLLVMIFVLQLLHLSVWGEIFQNCGFSGVSWRTAFGIAAFCLFCPNQYENFVWPTQVAFLIPVLALTTALAALLRLGQTSQSRAARIKALLLLLFSAVVGSYSLAHGILVWPLLLIGGMVLRLPLRLLGLLCVAGAITVGLFFVHYHSEAQLLSFLRSQLVEGANFVLLTLGESWKRVNSGVGAALAVFVIATLPVLLLRMIATKRRKDLFLFMPLAVILFCCATTTMIAIGRLRLGSAQASTSRYQTIAMFFWMAAALLVIRWLWKPRLDPAVGADFETSVKTDWLAILAFQSCVVIVMLFSTTAIPELRQEVIERRQTLETSTLALATGVPDVSLAGVIPNQAFVSQYFDSHTDLLFLQEMRASFYADSFYLTYGKSFSTIYNLAPGSECRGALESVRPIANEIGRGARVTGWAWDTRRNKPVSKLVIVTPDGLIAGLARGDGFGLQRQTSIQQPAEKIWRGFLQSLPQPVPLQAYALTASDAACALDTSDTVPDGFRTSGARHTTTSRYD